MCQCLGNKAGGTVPEQWPSDKGIRCQRTPGTSGDSFPGLAPGRWGQGAAQHRCPRVWGQPHCWWGTRVQSKRDHRGREGKPSQNSLKESSKGQLGRPRCGLLSDTYLMLMARGDACRFPQEGNSVVQERPHSPEMHDDVSWVTQDRQHTDKTDRQGQMWQNQ